MVSSKVCKVSKVILTVFSCSKHSVILLFPAALDFFVSLKLRQNLQHVALKGSETSTIFSRHYNANVSVCNSMVNAAH